MITIRNAQRRFHVHTATLRKIVATLLAELDYPDFDIGILLVSSPAMRQYNKQFRNKDMPTDVLSFPYYPDLKPRQRIKAKSPDAQNLGDIIICPAYAWQQLSDRYDWDDKSQKEKLDLLHARVIVLIVHGLCHLLGYDHQTMVQHRAMKRKELSLLGTLPALEVSSDVGSIIDVCSISSK